MIVATCEILLLGLLACGAIQDVLQFRLPNWLTLATAAVALPWLALTMPSIDAIFLHLAGGLVMLLVGVLAFRFKMLGGGDVKWLASIALWVGLSFDLMRFVMLTTLSGAALAVLVLLLARIWPSYGLQDGKRHLPYGVAIAAAGVDFWIRRSQLGIDLTALMAS